MGEGWSPKKRFQDALPGPLLDVPRDRNFLSHIRRKYGRRLGDLIFERGLDTSGGHADLDHFHRERTPYGPSPWLDVRRVLRKIDVKPTDVFVDFGSGKGRVIYQAARYPFARVVGVEISDRLNQVARANVDRNRDKLACKNIELVTIDAADFTVPDDMTIAYFYLPFSGETFKAVIDNIVRSIDHHPRPVRLIYGWPLMEDYILGTGRFKLVRNLKHGAHDPKRISLYVGDFSDSGR